VVAEFWSEITQDKDDQDKEWLYVQEEKDSNLNEKFFGCSFLLRS
jgi:predicted nucleic acid-binding Zn finger protein